GATRPSRPRRWSPPPRSPRSSRPSEVPLALLHFHRGVLVVVDEPPLALRALRLDHLPQDLGEGGGSAADRARERVAAERPKAHGLHLRRLAGRKRKPRVVDHDQGALALDDRSRRGEIERDDRDLLEPDVLPDVELGPVRHREGADALAL